MLQNEESKALLVKPFMFVTLLILKSLMLCQDSGHPALTSNTSSQISRTKVSSSSLAGIGEYGGFLIGFRGGSMKL